MRRPLTPEARAALRAAGSQALTGAARAEFERRIRAYPFDPCRLNMGGILDGAHGAGDRLASFPDLDQAARRLVALCRIAGGEHPADAAQGYDGDVGAFVSIAPEEGSGHPLEIEHWSRLMPGQSSGDPGTPDYVPADTAGIWDAAKSNAPYLAIPVVGIPIAAVKTAYDVATNPSDAAAHTFQDYAESWTALEKTPGIEQLAGPETWKKAHDSYVEFARAWKAGDDKSPECSTYGSACNDGIVLNHHLQALQTLRVGIAKKTGNKAWITSIPKLLSRDETNPIEVAVSNVLKSVGDKVPALSWWARFWAGELPTWQYVAVFAGTGTVGLATARAAFRPL